MTRLHRLLLPILCAALIAGGTLAATAEHAAAATPVTSITLTTSDDTAVIGQTVEFMVQVTTSGTPATGTVDIFDGASPICLDEPIVQISSFSIASCTTTTLSLGDHVIAADYSGDLDYDPASATPINQGVAAAATTIVATRSVTTLDPSVWSESVTFEGTISVTAPGGGIPAGTVRFQTDSVDIAGCSEAPIVSSTASCSTSALAFGAQQITAIYSGSPDHLTSTSANLQHTVDLAETTTVVSSSNPTTTFDAPVTYTAAISPIAPATVAPGSGTVSFEVDSVPIAGCTSQPVTAGAATCVTRSEPVGAPSITAVYGGDPTRYSGSTSTAIIQTVGNASSATAISASSNSSVFSEEVTLTATTSAVAPATTTPAGGTMSFTVNTVPITGCTTQTVTAGVATCVTRALPVGALNAISAVYSGDANFNTSTAPSQTQVVSKAATTSAAVSNQPTSTWNDSVTFTITVTQQTPATLAPSSGTASFTIAGTEIVGCETRPVVAGIATCVTSVVPVGTSSVIAAYSTDPSYLSSVAPAVTQTVSRANTNIALVSNHHPSRFGQVITLTATVTSTAGTPTGTVSFFVRKKDMTFAPLGTRALSGGVASIDTAALPVRIGTVLATYNTSTNFLTSSREIDQTVSRSFSRTLMRSSDRTTSFGRPVSFSVVVASDGDGAGTPTGLVALYLVRPNNSRQWIGRGNLRSGATTIVVSDLPVGTYKVVAEYRGSTTHRPSHRSLTQTITLPL